VQIVEKWTAVLILFILFIRFCGACIEEVGLFQYGGTGAHASVAPPVCGTAYIYAMIDILMLYACSVTTVLYMVVITDRLCYISLCIALACVLSFFFSFLLLILSSVVVNTTTYRPVNECRRGMHRLIYHWKEVRDWYSQHGLKNIICFCLSVGLKYTSIQATGDCMQFLKEELPMTIVPITFAIVITAHNPSRSWPCPGCQCDHSGVWCTKCLALHWIEPSTSGSRVRHRADQ